MPSKRRNNFSEKRRTEICLLHVGLIQCGVPLVSTTLDNVYGNAQVDLDNGLYLITHSSTGQKRLQIERISEALGLGIVVEII